MSGFIPTVRSIGLSIIALAGQVLWPALYLWPWLMGTAAFAAVLASEQGQALAAAFVGDAAQPTIVATAIVVTDVLLLLACILGLVAVVARRPPDSLVRTFQRGPRFNVVVDGFWTISLSSGFGVIFALQTRSGAAIAASLSVVGICVASWIWLASSVANRESLPRRALQVVHRHRLVLTLVVASVATVPLALGALVTINAPWEIGKLGPLLICMIGLAALSTLSGAALVIVPICVGRHWAGIVLVGLLTLTNVSLSPAVDDENSLIKDSKGSKTGDADDINCEMPPGSIKTALADHTPKQSSKSVTSKDHIYLVSAEGGGIRAAYWTGVNLGLLDADSADAFGDHVALVSGVSGGSLGIATWLAARERRDLTPQARLQLIKRFLGSDFLSPLVAASLFLDVPRIILGPLWFGARRDEVFEKAIADRWATIGNTTFFARPYYKLCVAGFKVPPGIVFNATDALTGRYVPLTNLRDLAQTTVDQELPKSTIGLASVAQIVHTSARFPYLSPAAEVGLGAHVIYADAAKDDLSKGELSIEEDEAAEKAIDRETEKIRSEHLYSRIAVLVDGGYFDNTGLTPTVHALEYITDQIDREAKSPKRKKVFSGISVEVIHLANDPGKLCLPVLTNDDQKVSEHARRFEKLAKPEMHCRYELADLEQSFHSSPLKWFFTPLEAIFSVRQAHSALMKDSVRLVTRKYNQTHASSTQYFNEYSVAKELQDAYQPEATSTGDDWGSFTPRDGLLMSMRDESDLSQLAYNAWTNGAMTFRVMLDYFRMLGNWHQEIQEMAAPCAKSRSLSAPPLGWTLTKENQELLDCLADKSSLRRRRHMPPFPPIDPLQLYFPKNPLTLYNLH